MMENDPPKAPWSVSGNWTNYPDNMTSTRIVPSDKEKDNIFKKALEELALKEDEADFALKVKTQAYQHALALLDDISNFMIETRQNSLAENSILDMIRIQEYVDGYRKNIESAQRRMVLYNENANIGLPVLDGDDYLDE